MIWRHRQRHLQMRVISSKRDVLFSGACWSPVGRTGNGEQRLSLGQRCWYLGIVIHELGHAVGFWHEMNRPDRDDWIYIYWNNIIPVSTANIKRPRIQETPRRIKSNLKFWFVFFTTGFETQPLTYLKSTSLILAVTQPTCDNINRLYQYRLWAAKVQSL
jgi:hypothetical protein